MQANQLASNELAVPGATEKVNISLLIYTACVLIIDQNLKLKLLRPVNLAELRRWRQQFLTYIKMHPPATNSDSTKVSNMFIEYINSLII